MYLGRLKAQLEAGVVFLLSLPPQLPTQKWYALYAPGRLQDVE
jgi:hypothetical protein